MKHLLTLALTSLLTLTFCADTHAQVKNIVLVHGAFADGSCWANVYKILKSRGYTVTIVQNPLTSLEDDVAATQRILDKQNGPAVLVGHSWGGSVITQVGVHDKVAALVYIAAFAPAVGETTVDLIKTAPPAPENGILPPDEKGFIYYDREKFHGGFCAEVSQAQSDLMFASQAPVSVKAFITPLSEAAWKTKPSYGIVATEDKSINPDIERMMYKRADAKVTELKGSHTLFITKAKEVADIIDAAAKATNR